jgi:ATP-dependent exoDNAse (exonuclease V) beta subunit
MKNITFIYAGAGSGKTHKLTDLLFEKINNKEITASEVMLTTFTKKAANEIKERAQAKLLTENSFEAANCLNQAYIGTVHSVGYQFIKKYWYLLGISPDIKEIGENEKEVIFSKAISEVPSESELTLLNELNSDFNFQKYVNDMSVYDSLRWMKDVKNIMELALTNQIDLEKDESSLLYSLDLQTSIFKGNKPLDSLINELKSNINILINNSLTVKGYDPLLKTAKELLVLTNSSEFTIDILSKIDAFNKDLKGLYGADRYATIKNQIIDFDISQTQIFQDKVTGYTKLIFEIARRSLAYYSTFKKQKGLIDFTDMEVYFLNLLNNEIVQEDIRNTLKLVMVDEFQDSNPIQLTIFMKLSELVQQSYWVGDPKQAIYGFRGSDPILIDKVMEKFTQKNEENLKVELLKMSWRSAAPLVEFSNSIFSNSLKNQVRDIYLEDKQQLNGYKDNAAFSTWKETVNIQPLPGSETISLFPARTHEQDIKGMKNLNFFNVLQNGSGGLKFAKNELFHHKVGKQVKQILSSKNVEIYDKSLGKHRQLVGSDICLLTISNSDVSKIAAELAKLGVPVNALIPGLTETVEYRFVKDVAILLLNQSNALAKSEVAFLNGDVKKWNELINQRIDFIIDTPKTEDAEELKKHYKAWLESYDFNKLIQQIQYQSIHLSITYTIKALINQFNLFLKTASFGNVSSRQANLIRLIELVEEYEESCIKMNIGTGLADFFHFIESSELNDMQKGNADKNAVQVMTYHKSKGLEWPIVFLLSLEKDPLDKFFKKKFFNLSVCNVGDFNIETPLKNRMIEFLWWPFGTKDSPNELLASSIEEKEIFTEKETNTLNESKRLLYVGVTRSRDALVLTSNNKKNLSWLESVIAGFNFENIYNGNNLETLYEGSIDLFQLNNSFNYSKVVVDETAYEEVAFVPYHYFKKEIPAQQDKPYLINPSKQVPVSNVEVVELVQLHDRLHFNPIETDQLGNTLHAMLYAKNKSYFQRNVTALNTNNKLGLDEQKFVENTHKFEDFIQATFKPLKQFPELHLEKIIGNQKAVGEADLVLELDNELVLIDYKSFPGKKEEIFSTTSEFYAGKYSGQLELYTQMLSDFSPKPITRKLIYYVVQGLVVDIK